MQAVLYKIPGQTWWWLGGMTLLERNLRLLEEIGVDSALILHPPEDPLPPIIVPRQLQLDARGAAVELATADPLTILPALPLEKHRPFFLFDVNLLLDPRVLETLSRKPPPCFLVLGNGSPTPPVWRVGWLRPEHVRLGSDVIGQAERVSLRSILPSEAPPPYCEKMKSEADLIRGWHLLLDRASQQQPNLLEKYVNAPVENPLVREFCKTPITPQQMGILAVSVALVGASLFYQGLLVLGSVFAWLSLILDSVKDKLSQVKLLPFSQTPLMTLADILIGPAWYLSLAIWLSRTQTVSVWSVGLGVIACELCDLLISTLFVRLTGEALEDRSDFDRRFRLISGQRGIYVFILFVGCVLGIPLVAFQAVLAWAGITLLIRAGRVAHHLMQHERKNTGPSV